MSIANIAVSTKDARWGSVEFDFSRCSFFDANMAAALYVVIARLRNELNDVSIVNVPSGIRTILQKNKFLNVFNQPDVADTNRETVPFKIFKLSAAINLTITSMPT